MNFLSHFKNFVVSLEKDCFDNVAFRQVFLYFQCFSQKDVAIPLCCIKKFEYFATSYNFTYIVSELEKGTTTITKIRWF